MYFFFKWIYGFCFKVVKFTPKSVKHEDPNMVSGCDSSRKFLEFSAKSVTNEIVMTYSYSVQVLVSTYKHFFFFYEHHMYAIK